MKIFSVITFFLFALFSCQPKSPQLVLVNDGQTDYVVVLSPNPSAEEVRAAEFLNLHVKQITDCALPVMYSADTLTGKYVHIRKDTAMAGGDDFRLYSDNDDLYIIGGANKGCVYGVSELLEKYLGVRYYAPDFVRMPHESTISIPTLNLEGTTPNDYRNVNGSFTENEEYKDFHRLHTIDDMFASGYYVHTFHKLIPWQEYFQSNPEYFALLNGKRVIDQLCLSNPEVLEVVSKKLEEEMKNQPEKLFWSVSQDDNFSYCHCDACTKMIEEEGSASGPVIHFVNRVAERFPDKIISTLAYQYSRKAPQHVKPQANVQVMLCTIELNRSKPIALDSTSQSFVTDIEAWGNLTNNLYLWDYTIDFDHCTSPFPNLHVLQPNLQFFVDNGVAAHFQQTNTGTGHEFSELKAYLLAKLLWNPDAEVNSIIAEFADGYYGKAAPAIRRYIYRLQDEINKSGDWLDIYGPPTNYQYTFLSDSNVSFYNACFDEAEQAVADDPEYLLHVQTARMPLQYAMMEIGKSDMFGPRGWYVEKGNNFILNDWMMTQLENFYQTGIKAQTAPINEAGLTVEQYYQATKRFVEVQVHGNKAFRKPVAASPLPASKYSKGDLAFLTNGVRGANDYKVHWLGWEAQDFTLTLDLENIVEADTIEISTLWDKKSWILHPKAISCSVSKDGGNYDNLATIAVEGDQRAEEVNRLFAFLTSGRSFRYVRFEVQGTLKLFDWHPSAGGGSWVFVDEIVVR